MHRFAIKIEAARAASTRAGAIFCLAWLLGGCATPKPAAAPQRFDLGAAQAASQAPAGGVPVWLASVHAPSSLDGTAMLYRLDYSDPLQSRAYAQARWSMPVPELLAQRLGQRLAATHPVLNPADGVHSRAHGVVLRVEVEDFEQRFASPEQSQAQVRLRATLSAWRGGVEHLLAQRGFEARQPCSSADAGGGVVALAAASDQALEALVRWLDAAALSPAPETAWSARPTSPPPPAPPGSGPSGGSSR